MFLNPLLLVLYCALIFWLSDQPVLSLKISLPHIDKVIHAGAYTIMGILAWRAFRPFNPQPALWVIVFCSLYGLSDEWHQSFVIGRTADFFDWLADTLGGLIAVWLMKGQYLCFGKSANSTNH